LGHGSTVYCRFAYYLVFAGSSFGACSLVPQMKLFSLSLAVGRELAPELSPRVSNGHSCLQAACAFRKSYPDVMVVQLGQDWDGYLCVPKT
jgi:hypothetical protein